MAEGGSGRQGAEAMRRRQARRGPASEAPSGEQAPGKESGRLPLGFPKSARLLRSADYRQVYAEGRRRNLGILTAISRATGEQPSRVGMAVSRSFGGAVQRNRLKRRLREAVRKHRADLGPGWDIVFHPRTEARGANWADLEAAVRTLFAELSARRTAPQGIRRETDS